MSNITALMKTSANDYSRLVTIILAMDMYMVVILYIIGMIGSILNIITFLHKQIRQNSCSVYFLATSIIDFCIMNVFVLMQIIGSFNKPLSDSIYSTRIWCKVGNYVMLLLPCLSSSYITLASFDRFCASSLNQTFRKWSHLKVSRIVVILVFVLWALFGLHIPIAYDYVKNIVTGATQCIVQTSVSTGFIILDGFFFSLFNGAIIPFLLCIFGLLIYRNIIRSRRRVNPEQNIRTGQGRIIKTIKTIQSRNDSHMLRMLSVQVFLTIIFNIPYVVIYLFNFFNRPPIDLYFLSLYIIFSFIARWFYYMNYCKTFYINTLTSKLFRESLRKQLVTYTHQKILKISRTVLSVQTYTR